MTLALVIPERIQRQIGEAETWWRENRPAAPKLFANELANALRFIVAWPNAGAKTEKEGVRKYVLQASHYILLYSVGTEAVRLVRFRHARQRPLKALR